jgi:choline dehydrogenase
MIEPRHGNGHGDVARRFDYIIVGAGSAGCVVARRLVEGTEATVLVLEAGGSDDGVASLAHPEQWPSNIGSRYDWAYTYAPSTRLANRPLPLPRGKVLGGSGSINAMLWARGHRADYDSWAEAGNVGWDFQSVLPLFKKSEDWEDGPNEYRGAGGPMRVERARELHPVAAAFIEACRFSGMPYLDDMNVPHPEGVGPHNVNIRDGLRCSPSSAFLRPVIPRRNLTVWTGAQAVELRLSGSRCIGVNVLVEGKRQSIDASREVILCAGAIDSPRLLMLSGIGPHLELKRLDIKTVVDLPGVGRNLQDHVLVAGLCFEPKDSLTPPSGNLCGSAAFWKSRPDLRVPDLMFVVVQGPFLSDEIRARYAIPEEVFTILPALVRPQSRGFVRMKSAKHDGPLEIQPNFLAERADVDALVSSIEIGLDIASRPALRQLIERRVAPVKGQGLSRDEIVTFLRRACVSYWHPVGTCAMGSGRDAVVDADLRVHGVDGLRIADASIMPTITSANTNAPCVMIGEFAARRIVASSV